jgi:hypothetical protein
VRVRDSYISCYYDAPAVFVLSPTIAGNKIINKRPPLGVERSRKRLEYTVDID